MSRRAADEHGAAALEFALVLPVLLLILLGILEFGRVYNAQVTLSAAVREGARVMAIDNDPAAARTATRNAAPSLTPALTDSQIEVQPASCAAGQNVAITTTYPIQLISGYFGTSFTLNARGVMRCGG